MKAYIILFALYIPLSCSNDVETQDDDILGFELLSDVNGHWVGSNETAFGFYDWFAFDFRPISPSHSHSIYEGAANQNIITSIFLAEYEGKKQIMARNGGWLGNQYRATYFILDKAENRNQEKYYRLVDAVGGPDRSYMEFRFVADSIYMDAYKDNSGTLDQPIHHMGFAGSNRNPSYSQKAVALFDYPQETIEVNLNNQFSILIDKDSALFLEEDLDPFPKSDHGHISDLRVDIKRNTPTQNQGLLFFLSKSEVVSEDGSVNWSNLDNTVIRTIDLGRTENNYTCTYLHPDDYFVTIFHDLDGDGIPSSGDYSSSSKQTTVLPNSQESVQVEIEMQLP